MSKSTTTTTKKSRKPVSVPIIASSSDPIDDIFMFASMIYMGRAVNMRVQKKDRAYFEKYLEDWFKIWDLDIDLDSEDPLNSPFCLVQKKTEELVSFFPALDAGDQLTDEQMSEWVMSLMWLYSRGYLFESRDGKYSCNAYCHEADRLAANERWGISFESFVADGKVG